MQAGREFPSNTDRVRREFSHTSSNACYHSVGSLMNNLRANLGYTLDDLSLAICLVWTKLDLIPSKPASEVGNLEMVASLGTSHIFLALQPYCRRCWRSLPRFNVRLTQWPRNKRRMPTFSSLKGEHNNVPTAHSGTLNPKLDFLHCFSGLQVLARCFHRSMDVTLNDPYRHDVNTLSGRCISLMYDHYWIIGALVQNHHEVSVSAKRVFLPMMR